MNDYSTYITLATALAIGLLIGIERGWHERESKEGERIAGIRTYGLIGLLGGVAALLGTDLAGWVVAVVFLGLAVAWSVAYVMNFKRESDASITSIVAGLLTFGLSVLAGLGYTKEASAAAVATTILLGLKPELHKGIYHLQRRELKAGFKLLLISVVLLPILPNKGYGPWDALNPYHIWWMVVIIALISFVGYFSVKVIGAQKGLLFTGLFAGLSSSTAVTLHFSKLVRSNPQISMLASVSVLVACATMFPRTLVVVTLFDQSLFVPLLVPMGVMGIIVYVISLLYWRTGRKIADVTDNSSASALKNPLDLSVAIRFGVLLSLIMLLSKGLQQYFGDAGLYVLSVLSGIADVDAISLSFARMHFNEEVLLNTTITGIVLASATNSIVKGALAIGIGGANYGLKVGLPLLVASLAGVASVWLMNF
jgi:uncharacterized membrane protein (DUF4010 family)